MKVPSVSRLAWLTSPSVDEVPRSHAVAMSALRILAGLLWLYNVSWKRPPDFGQDFGNGLYGFTQDAVEHPVFGPFSWVVEHVVLPNFTVFGWSVLVVETALAVCLLTGAYVRLAALVGIAQSLAIGLSVAQTPGEWPWSYWMMVGIHVVILFGAAGRVLAVDAVRARLGRGEDPRRQLLMAWGGVAVIAAIVAIVLSLGDDALTTSGAALGGPGLSISLGSYNLLGAAALLGAGLALPVAAAAPERRWVALVALVIGVGSAGLLHAQLGFTDPWLGGTATSAAFFLCLATVGWCAFVGRRSAQSSSRDTPRTAVGS